MRLWAIGSGVITAALGVALCGAPQRAAFAAGVPWCAGDASRQAAQKVPVELAATVARAFDVSPDVVGAGAVVRCVDGRAMACWVGANLDCGKADMRRKLPGATAFCRENPGADGVPMAATGHATIYDWRCVGSRAVAGKIIAPVDPQGYIADNWKEVR